MGRIYSDSDENGEFIVYRARTAAAAATTRI